MKTLKTAFIEFALNKNVLKFGEFQLKSGRISPYFFNAGLFDNGQDMLQLCQSYAQAIYHSKVHFDVLFGPAYKGIPLATGTAMSLAHDYQRETPFCYNRKETKDHGEGGNMVGAPLTGDVLIIDDVITAGTAIREAINMIQSAGAHPAGVVIALDRQEKGQGELSAIQEVEKTYQIPVIPIITLEDLANYLKNQQNKAILKAINQYRNKYGIHPLAN